MNKIKIVVSEIDGVITDGVQPIDELGNTVFKNFYTPDFEAINKIKVICPFVFLSNDNSVSYNLCKKKNIPFFWAQKSKRTILLDILRKYSVTLDDVVYIGSKLSDLECMNMVPISFCTNDFISTNFKSFMTLPGEGILTELYLNYISKGDLC